MKNKMMLSTTLALILIFGMVANAFAAMPAITIQQLLIDNETALVTIQGTISSGIDRRVSIVVKDPDGNESYMSQVNSGIGGRFEFIFRLKLSSKNGLYTAYFNGSQVSEYTVDTFHVELAEIAPQVDNVSIGGAPHTGQTITAEYEYFHLGEALEGQSIIEWFEAEHEEGPYVQIANVSGKSYNLTYDDAYKYIKFKITPKSVGISKVGTTKESMPVYVLATPYVNSVRIVGEGRSGQRLVGDYKYYHPSNNAEANSEFKWYRTDASGANGVLIGSEIGYTTNDGDVGKYIVFEVTPKTSVHPQTGTAVKSSPLQIADAKKNNTVGNSGSSGSYLPVIIPPAGETPSGNNLPETGTVFNDMGNHSWASEAVQSLYDLKIVFGKEAQTFAPDERVTRAEFIVFIARVLNLPQETNKSSMTDIKENDWFAGAVQAALDIGIVSGFAGQFRPDDNITREEMTKIIVEAYKMKKGNIDIEGNVDKFSDKEEMSQWAIEYIGAAEALGFIKGVEADRFDPRDYASRAQAAVIIKRLYDSLAN